MSIYSINIPSNVEIYVQEFRKMVAFEILKPDNMIKVVDKDLNIWMVLAGEDADPSREDMDISSSLESSG